MNLNLNKIIELYNKLNSQARYGILGGVAFAILLLDVFFLVLPQIGSIAHLNEQIKTMSDGTREVLTDRQRLLQLKKNLQLTRDQLNALNSRVRPVQEVPAILSTISSIANEYGVKIDQLIPAKTQQETLKSPLEGKYYALPVVIKARCGYHMFGRFFNKLENENMYFIVKDFIIQNDGAETNSHSFSLTIKLILVDHNGAGVKKP